jgi:hypothetical protein
MGLGNGKSLQRIDPEPLLVLAEWHERRALEQDRFASNAGTDLWRTGCERRASFHRMIGDYLRALHCDLLKSRNGRPDGEREIPLCDSSPVAPSEHDEEAPASPIEPPHGAQR